MARISEAFSNPVPPAGRCAGRSGSRWASREEDFDKPKIAVVNSSSGLSVCYQHLDQVSKAVQQAIRDAGGLPFEIRTVAPSDFVTSAGRKGRYLMPTRDLLVNDVEVQVEGAELDGMVLLASDKTTPGQIMAGVAHSLAGGDLRLPVGRQLRRRMSISRSFTTVSAPTSPAS